MDKFGTSQLRELMGEQSAPCVSIYMPTHVAGEQGQQDPVRFKNLLQRAEVELAAEWGRSVKARELLKQPRTLIDNSRFWEDRSHGLALFVNPASFQYYRLPLRFDEVVSVNRRFHVKPLLPLMSDSERFFILALSQNRVQFFSASRYAIDKVDVKELPVNMEDTLNYAGADRGAQVHSAAHAGKRKEAAVFHGQGGEADTRKEDLTQFFRQIDAALQPTLRDEIAPLLLAGVDYLFPIYRQVSSYAHIAQPEMTGNCDYLTPHEIHERAWPLMEPVFRRSRDESAAKYAGLMGTGKASDNIGEIVPAAHQGRIESLFLNTRASQWGRYDSTTNRVELHGQHQPGDDDLVDLAAVQTLLGRGAVYTDAGGPVPSGLAVAAVFRY